MKGRILKGYLFSRGLYNYTYASQKIQNLVIRSTSERYGYKYKLGAVEYIMKDSFLILNSLIDDNIDEFDCLGFYSLFQLPIKTELRQKILKRILTKKKTIIFCNEKIIVENYHDLEEVEINYKMNFILKIAPQEIFFQH